MTRSDQYLVKYNYFYHAVKIDPERAFSEHSISVLRKVLNLRYVVVAVESDSW